MVFMQRCVFKSIFQHGQCFLGSQEARKSFASKFGSNLLAGHRAVAHRTKSSGADVNERTLIAVKPDGVQRCLIGQIIQRFEQRGFKLVGLKMLQVPEELLSEHYRELTTRPFYPILLRYMTSGPVVVMVWEGNNVVQTSRLMVGPTDPATAPAGTIRGDFSVHVSRNVIHASDSLESARREIQLWFQGNELVTWDSCHKLNIQE